MAMDAQVLGAKTLDAKLLDFKVFDAKVWDTGRDTLNKYHLLFPTMNKAK